VQTSLRHSHRISPMLTKKATNTCVLDAPLREP
jgi:hypothetical protein